MVYTNHFSQPKSEINIEIIYYAKHISGMTFICQRKWEMCLIKTTQFTIWGSTHV